VLAAELSAELGLIPPEAVARIRRHLDSVGLPTKPQDIAGFMQEGLADADRMMELMAQDKKVKRGRLTFIVLDAIGRAAIRSDIDPAMVRGFLAGKLGG
jgi:3-dehydroquinate synthetase